MPVEHHMLLEDGVSGLSESLGSYKSGGLRGRFRLQRAKYKTWKKRIFTKFAYRAKTLPVASGIHRALLRMQMVLSQLIHFLARIFLLVVIFASRLFSLVFTPVRRLAHAIARVLQENAPTILKTRTKIRYAPLARIPAIALILAGTIAVLSACYFGLGLEVYVDGEPIGFVETQQDVTSVVQTVENRAAYYLGRPYNLNVDIRYKLRLMDRKQMVNSTALESMLFDKVSEVSLLSVLKVNGEIVGANESKTALEIVLNEILKAYGSASENTRTEFVQDVEIAEMPASNSMIKSADEMKAMLLGDTVRAVTYTVKEGDTANNIAGYYGTSLSRFLELNPEIDFSALTPGRELSVQVAQPMVSVKQIKRISYTEAIPFKTTIQKTDTLYKNNKKTVTAGVNGQKQITADVVMINGRETQREIISAEILSEPIDEVIQVGTKDPPPKSPTGTFMYPYKGMLTSNYGYRGREFHTGIDLAGPVGSRIVAADGGKVVFAGWKGNYGKCVIISHGNGLQTLYAHCSSLVVTVGQKVGKGELIAKVGSTGRSTGPHCHFEVRVNGKHVSPWKYLKR